MEDQEKYYKNQAKIYQKKSKLRELVLQCDWKKDGFMLLSGKRVEYISAAKVARNFAPLLPKVGLEIITQFGEPVHYDPVGQKGEEHFVVPFTVSYVDIETGVSSVPCTYYGESVDPRDKGLKKACTDARKLWLIADFNIEEGIDPELSGSEGTFSPKSEEEDVEIKTKIAANAIKPKAPAPKPKKAEEPVKTETEATAEEMKEVADTVKEATSPIAEISAPPVKPKPKAPAKVKKEETAKAPAEDEDPSRVAPGMNTEYGAKITEVQKKPLFAAFSKWRDAHMAGKISDEKYEEVKDAYRNIGSNSEVIRFLAQYREVKE